MEKQTSTFDQIVKSLASKASVKIEVIANVMKAYELLKTSLKKIESDLLTSLSKIDNRIVVKYHERGEFDIEFKISDDVIMFSKHTDAYVFHSSHQIWKNSYVEGNETRAFCGMISIYNFLTDSLKYNRLNDKGVLIARIFINHENHFFVEGKKQLGFTFNDFESATIDDKNMKAIIETAILYCLESDIITPPFEQVNMISVQEIIEKNLSSVISTGKRLGFRLQSDNDPIL